VASGYHPVVTRGALLFTLSLLAAACSSSSNEPAPTSEHGWTPGVIYPTQREITARGFLDRRGLIHAHSVYSHDACDGKPRDDQGNIDTQCLDDFRAGLCFSRHDFVMLTDHDTYFAGTEYPDSLLYDASRGDELLEREGHPVASWLACPEGAPALILAGCEQRLMPVGLESHVAASQAERSQVYGANDPDLEPAISADKAHEAVTLVAHTEGWTPEELETLPLDGFEMYNLHANAIRGAGAALDLIGKLLKSPEELPYPDLVFLPIVSEDPAYIDTWGSVLASGARRVTTMATDCHRNSFPQILPDGERIDSYRRMMVWFSNHLLVQPDASGGFGDRELKEALRAGRLYGAFEAFGFPVGFDYHAESGDVVVEMGGEAELATGVDLVATLPNVENLDSHVTPPEITLRLLRAKAGGWDLIDESNETFRHTVTSPGAYRLEVRIKPRHLLAELASYADLAEKDFVWIYSNAIYVT
jgi:hypothetical protein